MGETRNPAPYMKAGVGSEQITLESLVPPKKLDSLNISSDVLRGRKRDSSQQQMSINSNPLNVVAMTS